MPGSATAGPATAASAPASSTPGALDASSSPASRDPLAPDRSRRCPEAADPADLTEDSAVQGCSGHGVCAWTASGATCLCERGWHGASCSHSTCSSEGSCSGRGVCISGVCRCPRCWFGNQCATLNESAPGCAREGLAAGAYFPHPPPPSRPPPPTPPRPPPPPSPLPLLPPPPSEALGNASSEGEAGDGVMSRGLWARLGGWLHGGSSAPQLPPPPPSSCPSPTSPSEPPGAPSGAPSGAAASGTAQVESQSTPSQQPEGANVADSATTSHSSSVENLAVRAMLPHEPHTAPAVARSNRTPTPEPGVREEVSEAEGVSSVVLAVVGGIVLSFAGVAFLVLRRSKLG